MGSKETDARIRIDKMLLESGWKLPGWYKDKEINVLPREVSFDVVTDELSTLIF